MKQTLLVLIIFFSLNIFSQDTKMEKGKLYCYVPLTVINFDINKEYESLGFFADVKELEYKNLEPQDDKLMLFKGYQKFLKEMKYDVKINGVLDEFFLKSHNLYLKEQKKNNIKRYNIIKTLKK